MRRSIIAAVAAIAATATIAVAAFSTTYYDAVAQEGYVDKGAVQVVFGWNNSQLQANHTGVSFSYVEQTVKIQDCVDRDRGVIIDVVEDVVRTSGISSTVDISSTKGNKNGQFNGWFLGAMATPNEVKTGGCPAGYQPNGPAQETSTAELRATRNGVTNGIWAPAAE
jgi:hypothetical protein